MKTPEMLAGEWARKMAALNPLEEQRPEKVLETMVEFIRYIQHDALTARVAGYGVNNVNPPSHA